MQGMNGTVSAQYMRLLGDIGIHLVLPDSLPPEGWAQDAADLALAMSWYAESEEVQDRLTTVPPAMTF